MRCHKLHRYQKTSSVPLIQSLPMQIWSGGTSARIAGSGKRPVPQKQRIKIAVALRPQQRVVPEIVQPGMTGHDAQLGEIAAKARQLQRRRIRRRAVVQENRDAPIPRTSAATAFISSVAMEKPCSQGWSLSSLHPFGLTAANFVQRSLARPRIDGERRYQTSGRRWQNSVTKSLSGALSGQLENRPGQRQHQRFGDAEFVHGPAQRTSARCANDSPGLGPMWRWKSTRMGHPSSMVASWGRTLKSLSAVPCRMASTSCWRMDVPRDFLDLQAHQVHGVSEP